MAKKKQEDIELPVASTLVKSREEVKSLLEAQIEAAEPILAMQVSKGAKYNYDMLIIKVRNEEYRWKLKES